MPARTGSEFLQRLASTRRHVEIQGETLTGDIASHPAFGAVVRTYAALFDMQHAPEHRNVLTYPSPSSGRSRGHLVPRAAYRWATWSSGARRSRYGRTRRSACSAGPATT